MECQKITNLLDIQTTQPSKFRTKTWVEISDDRRGAYDKKILILRLQCGTQVYVIIVMHICLLKEQ